MTWPEFIVEMSRAWAWPAVTGAGIILLRKQIKAAATSLVDRVGDITHLKAPGVEVDFEREVEELAKTTKELETETPKALPPTQLRKIVLPPETTDEHQTKYQQLAILDPRSAILGSFADLESMIRHRFRALYPEERTTVSFGRIVSLLGRDGRLDDDSVEVLKSMSRIRNQVAHELRPALDQNIANSFVESTGNMLAHLLLSDFFSQPGKD